MPATLGTSTALFRVGSGQPCKVFRGSVPVQDVPVWSGSPLEEAYSDGTETYIYLTTQGLWAYGLPILNVLFFADVDEDLEVVPYDLNIGDYIEATFTYDGRGQQFRVVAQTAVGFSAPSVFFPISTTA